MLEYIIFTVVISLLLSTWLRKYLRNDVEAVDEVDGAIHFTPKHILAKRGSSRRKAFYKPNSQLHDYLERNLSKGGDHLNFQSNFPWKTFIDKSRHQSKILDLDQSEIKLYESIFEIILTERSYIMQLEQLTNFDTHHENLEKISKYDRNLLLGNIVQLHAANQELYTELVSDQSDIFMRQTFNILSRFLCNGSFEPYIDYIRSHQERNRLINDEDKILKVPDLTKLRSLIIIPMQRITRYPLLIQNVRGIFEKILSKSPNSTVSKTLDRSAIEKCFQDASKFATKCNKALDDQGKLYDLITLKKQLVSPTGSVAIDDLVAPNRSIFQRVQVKLYFVKQGNGQNSSQAVPMPAFQGGSLFRSFNSMNKVKSTLILLTDMLIIAEFKQKKDQYIVIDHDKLTNIQFDRRRDSIVSGVLSNDFSSNESIEKINEKAPEEGNVKAQCTLTLKSSENSYGVNFFSIDEEGKFIQKLHQLKAEATSNSCSPPRSANGY